MDANINQDIEIFFMGGDRTIHIEDNGEEPLNAKDIAIEVFDFESIDRYSKTNEGAYMEDIDEDIDEEEFQSNEDDDNDLDPTL